MASVAHMRFYAELNDFLPPGKRQVTFAHSFFGRPTVKDLIESLGVPHTEVDLILVGGVSADFSRRVVNGSRISVFPVFEALDISPILQVRPEPLREPRFVLDTHLGKLASYLRMLGFDTLYQNHCSDETLAAISANEQRILLTRDRGLLKRSAVIHGYLVRADNPREQLAEALHRFDLLNTIKPFRRCMRCNELLEIVTKEAVSEAVPPRILKEISEFRQCPACRRVYWKGSHYKKMADFIRQLTAKTSES
jgi:uncharacterized protein